MEFKWRRLITNLSQVSQRQSHENWSALRDWLS